MYKNKNGSRNNITGMAIKRLRLARVPKMSQRALADAMQLQGIDLDKNAIQRIESGERFITDIELIAFSSVFNVLIEDLYIE